MEKMFYVERVRYVPHFFLRHPVYIGVIGYWLCMRLPFLDDTGPQMFPVCGNLVAGFPYRRHGVLKFFWFIGLILLPSMD